MALNFVRGVVSGDLKRHVEAAWDLNLTYILSNLIAMSYPGEGVEGMYRNDITQVAEYLDHKHQDHYMIFNLSERVYNFDLFHGRVVDFGWPDHHGPPLQMLIDVVSSMDRWLRADSRNVAIVHCLAGRGRTGTAICAYLCYAGYFASMMKSLQYYANVRSNKGKGVTQPSQLRYCKYIDIILNKPLIPKPKTVSITRLTISPVPNMTSQLGIRPILNIFRYAPGVQELIWTSLKTTNEAPWFGQKDGEVSFDLSDLPPIAGDIMIKLSHVTTWMWVGSKTEVVMRLIMNTSFFGEGSSVITLTKRDLDIAHKDARFSPDTKLFLYTTVIPDGAPPSKHDWDPEKFDEWFAAAKEYRQRCKDDNEPIPNKPRPSSITFHPFAPPDTSFTPTPPMAESSGWNEAATSSSNGAFSSEDPSGTHVGEDSHSSSTESPQTTADPLAEAPAETISLSEVPDTAPSAPIPINPANATLFHPLSAPHSPQSSLLQSSSSGSIGSPNNITTIARMADARPSGSIEVKLLPAYHTPEAIAASSNGIVESQNAQSSPAAPTSSDVKEQETAEDLNDLKISPDHASGAPESLISAPTEPTTLEPATQSTQHVDPLLSTPANDVSQESKVDESETVNQPL